MIWLTGGPSCASGAAALTKNGPLLIDSKTGKTKINPHGWNGVGDIVYVDQPLGAGFSVARDPADYVNTEAGLVEHLRQFLPGFLAVIPQFVGRPLYLTSESYAGHYLTAWAASLLRHPIDGVALSGVAMGNPWVNPKVQYLSMPPFALDNGLITPDEKDEMDKLIKICVEMIDRKLYDLAFNMCHAMVWIIRGNRNGFDVRLDCEFPGEECCNITGLTQFMNKPEVQRRLGVNIEWQQCNDTVEYTFIEDYLEDMTPNVLDIVDAGLPLLVNSGNEDYMCNHRGSLDWMLRLDWPARGQFARAPFLQWVYKGQSRALLKSYKNLHFLIVENAGHMVPMDQPVAARGLLEQFIDGTLAASTNGASTATVDGDSIHQEPFLLKAPRHESHFMAKQTIVVAG